VSQSLSQVMGQYMRMEQRLTPQLIQSMDILQLNIMALENRVAEELEKNVALEREELEQEAPAQPQEGREDRNEALTPEAASFNRLDGLSREYDLDAADAPYRP